MASINPPPNMGVGMRKTRSVRLAKSGGVRVQPAASSYTKTFTYNGETYTYTLVLKCTR